MNFDSMYQRIKSKQQELAKVRDELRELIANAQDILDDVEEADDDLWDALKLIENAADTLSELQ